MFLCFILSRLIQNSCSLADIGPVRPVARPRASAAAPGGEVAGRAILRDLNVAETLSALQDQIEGLTLGIPDVRTDEHPLMLQRHITGMPRRWTRLLETRSGVFNLFRSSLKVQVDPCEKSFGVEHGKTSPDYQPIM